MSDTPVRESFHLDRIARTIAIVAMAAILCACQPRPAAHESSVEPALVPQPVSYVPARGSFEVRNGTPLVARAGDAAALATARYVRDVVRRTRGLTLDVSDTAPSGDAAIELVVDPAFTADGQRREEAYRIDVTPRRITLTASTQHGLFDAGVTLWQLLTQDAAPATAVRVTAARIVDYPRFAWRGLLLDSARHFQRPEFVERFIDAMALHKLDVLHWHLTDDQGWRIEIRKYPELTRIGAWRKPLPDEANLVDPATGLYGGYYTQEQIRGIVRYAAARHVTIVPEIDMPGHAQAAIAAYPRLGVTGKRPPVSSDWGVHSWLFNVDEATFAFIDDVLGEVTELFPSPYIHVGGDEAAKDQWKASAQVQQRMRDLGIKDEQALQGYFTARLDKMLRERGRRLVGWDEILEGGLPPGAVVMSYRGAAGAVAATRQGDDAVMAPDPVVYFDHLQGTGRDQPPGRVKVVSLADVYGFDPLPGGLDGEQAGHVLGAQGNLWSEYLTTPQRVELAAFPRAAALAERLWSPPARTDWDGFVARLPVQFARYRALGIDFSDSAFAPRMHVEAGRAGRFRVALSKQIAFGAIHYTLDGSEPLPSSPVYRAPLDVDAGTNVRAATFAAQRRLSAARGERADATAARRRYSDALGTCGDTLLLRVEGAPGASGAAPLYDVDLMNSCWIYPKVDLAATSHIAVRLGALPYFFRLWHDAARVVRHPPAGPADELQLHLDRCDGPLLAAVPLPPAREDARTLDIPAPRAGAAMSGLHDVCLYFATHSNDPLRLIDWVEPVPRGE